MEIRFIIDVPYNHCPPGGTHATVVNGLQPHGLGVSSLYRHRLEFPESLVEYMLSFIAA